MHRELLPSPLLVSHPYPTFLGPLPTLVIVLTLSWSVTAWQLLFLARHSLLLIRAYTLRGQVRPHALAFPPKSLVSSLPHFLFPRDPVPLQSDDTWSGLQGFLVMTSSSSQGTVSSLKQLQRSSLESWRLWVSHPLAILDEVTTLATLPGFGQSPDLLQGSLGM